jgi:DNA-binding MarR family transcriptional regulator
MVNNLNSKKTTITPSEQKILEFIASNPKTTLEEIKHGTGKGLSTVSRLVRNLHTKELIIRKIYDDGDKIDARSTTIEVKENVRTKSDE